jgi:hypothetical protein
MSTDRLKQLAIALGVLVVLWGAATILRQGFDSGSDEFVLAEIDVDAIDSIVVQRAEDNIRLIRRASDWAVNGFRADSAGVAQLLALLEEEPAAQLAGQSASSHGRFEIDEASGRRLRAYAGGTVAVDLMVGKRGRDFQNVYVRHPDQDEVYILQSRLATYVDRRLEDWRNKVVARVIADSVSSIEIHRAEGQYSATREADSVWTVGADTADLAQVKRVLDQFQNLSASGFPNAEQMDSVSFDSPDRRAILRDASGSIVVDLALDSLVGGFWARRDGDTVIYKLDTFRVNQLTPPDSTLRGN